MTEIGETRSFPLRTILSIIHANDINGKALKAQTSEADAMELLRHMYPSVLPKKWQEKRLYLRNQFAALLSKQFPHLAYARTSLLEKVDDAWDLDEWMEVQESEFGEHIDVPVVGKGPRN